MQIGQQNGQMCWPIAVRNYNRHSVTRHTVGGPIPTARHQFGSEALFQDDHWLDGGEDGERALWVMYTHSQYGLKKCQLTRNLPKLGGIGGHAFGLRVLNSVCCILAISGSAESLVALELLWLSLSILKFVMFANITSSVVLMTGSFCGVCDGNREVRSGRNVFDAVVAGIVSFVGCCWR